MVKEAVIMASILLFSIYKPHVSCFAESAGSIAFVSNRDGGTEIYVMDSDGANQRRLTYDLRKKGEPAWSLDGKYISYHGEDTYGRTGIHVVNVDGTNQRQLTMSYDMGAVWSPDEQSIAFYSYRDGNWEIYVMSTDGMNQHSISCHPETDTYPSWSPDGRFLAFHTQRDGNWEIYMMNADGTNQRRLTQNDAKDWVPAWSPDGEKIAFWSTRDGSWQIYTMYVDGSTQQKITNEPAKTPKGISRPAWSPDSCTVAFVSIRDGNSEIYVMKADGTNQRRLTVTDQEEYDPAWSPF